MGKSSLKGKANSKKIVYDNNGGFQVSFSINYLEVFHKKECNYNLYKGLLNNADSPSNKIALNKRKIFYFNDFFEHSYSNSFILNNNSHFKTNPDFFGKRINIQAIVGENCSGKSSLMDLIYAAINNFAFAMVRGQDQVDGEFLLYIPGVFLNLHFSQTVVECSNGCEYETQRNFLLCCEDRKISLKQEKDNSFDVVNEYELNYENGLFNIVKESVDYRSISDVFFYTIVSNYSLQSFISSNYTYDAYRMKFYEGAISIEKDCSPWIDKIFHKNDGYLRPIVLNPFRGGGKIDLNNEIQLSKDRLTATLIFARQQESKDTTEKINFDLRYHHLEIHYKNSFLLKKVNEKYSDKSHNAKLFENNESLYESTINLLSNFTFVQYLKKYKISLDITLLNDIQKNGITYLCYKILWISERYAHYRQNGTKALEFNLELKKIVINDEIAFGKLLEQIKSDKSHVTKKIWRTLRFLYIKKTVSDKLTFEKYYEDILNFYKNTISEDNPFNLSQGNFLSPTDADYTLPPSIFEYELFVEENGRVVNYQYLSSGKLQQLQTLSVHMYHIGNIFSIAEGNSKSSVKYKNVNLVFDELEICFHPEFQRTFINYLLEWIEMLRISKDPIAPNKIVPISLNIFVVTHSPFILSDIPRNNITYLKEGSQVEKNIQPFAANISELLTDSFFLERGFIGEFARKKIIHFINEVMNGSVLQESVNSYKTFINDYIEDPYLRKVLTNLLKNRLEFF